MLTKIIYDSQEMEIDLSERESTFYKKLSAILTTLPVPCCVSVFCPLGRAEYRLIKKSGAFFIKEEANTIRFTKSNDYPEVYLTCINPQWNSYKYYRLTQQGDEVIATYGRIGVGKGEVFGERTHAYPKEMLKEMFWIKYNEKIAKDYVDQSDIYLRKTEQKKSQITVDVPETTQKDLSASAILYQKLKSFARHYVENSCISNEITQAMVDESRRLLNILYQRKAVKGFNNTLLKLLTVCPRRVRNVSDLLAVGKKDFSMVISREENLISAMEVLVTDPQKPKQEGKFEDVEVYKGGADVFLNLNPEKHVSHTISPVLTLFCTLQNSDLSMKILYASHYTSEGIDPDIS